MRTAAMILTSASGLVTILLSVAAVQGRNEWRVTYSSTQMCAFNGSSVHMWSTYSCPSEINDVHTTVQKAYWFIEKFVDLKTQSQFAGRVRSSCIKNKCSLILSDLRETDSAEYKFRIVTNHRQGAWFGSPGVSLSVKAHPDLQVHVRTSSPCSDLNCVSVQLRCQSRCPLPDHSSYTWFKNGREMKTHTSSYSDIVFYGDTISCVVKGYEGFSSPPMFGPRVPSVSVSPSTQIEEGISVNLSCTSDANPPVTKYTWYKENPNTDKQTISEKIQIVFESVQLSDSGQYYCTAENNLWVVKSTYIYLDVKDAPRRPSVSVNPSGQIAEGGSVTLSCTSDANPPVTTYTWYKEDEDSPTASGQNFTITDFRSEHSGSYYCEAQNSRVRYKSELHLIVMSDNLTTDTRTRDLSRAVGVAFAVLLPIILLVAFTLIKMKKASIKSPEPEVTPDHSEQRPPNQRQSEEQDNIHYVAVNFSKNQEDPIYANTGAAQRHIRNKEHMFTEYAAVKFHNTRKGRRAEPQEAGEDPALLYSTVNKPQPR